MVYGRSVWFVAPGRVDVTTEALPALRSGQAMVRTAFSGISSGTELLAYRGELDPDLPLDETIGALGGTFHYPFRYGYSCVGVVEESRSDIAEGATVFAFHPHQDRFIAEAPDLLQLGAANHRTATLYPLVETALQITLDAGPVLDETVIVFGLGAVGLLSTLMLRRAGARPVAVEPRAWRRDAAARLGIPALHPDDVAGDDRTRSVPLVIEASGNPAVLPAALALLAHEGTALVASWYGTKQVPLPLGDAFHRRRLTIRSTQVSTIPARLSDRWTAERRRRAVVELLAELPLDVLATHTFPFDDAAAAYRAVSDGEEGLIHAALGYG